MDGDLRGFGLVTWLVCMMWMEVESTKPLSNDLFEKAICLYNIQHHDLGFRTGTQSPRLRLICSCIKDLKTHGISSHPMQIHQYHQPLPTYSKWMHSTTCWTPPPPTKPPFNPPLVRLPPLTSDSCASNPHPWTVGLGQLRTVREPEKPTDSEEWAVCYWSQSYSLFFYFVAALGCSFCATGLSLRCALVFGGIPVREGRGAGAGGGDGSEGEVGVG